MCPPLDEGGGGGGGGARPSFSSAATSEGQTNQRRGSTSYVFFGGGVCVLGDWMDNGFWLGDGGGGGVLRGLNGDRSEVQTSPPPPKTKHPTNRTSPSIDTSAPCSSAPPFPPPATAAAAAPAARLSASSRHLWKRAASEAHPQWASPAFFVVGCRVGWVAVLLAFWVVYVIYIHTHT